MNIATIKDDVCIGVYVFESLETARETAYTGLLGDMDDLLELPDGYGIGDSYLNGGWSKKPVSAGVLGEIYQDLTINTIRKRYSINDEAKILRQYLANPDNEEYVAAFKAYNDYVEESKVSAKIQIYGSEELAEMDILSYDTE